MRVPKPPAPDAGLSIFQYRLSRTPLKPIVYPTFWEKYAFIFQHGKDGIPLNQEERDKLKKYSMAYVVLIGSRDHFGKIDDAPK